MNNNISNNIKCDCKGCTNRKIGCHSNCKKYAEYKEKISKQNKERAKQNLKYVDYGNRLGKSISNGINMFS